MSSIQLFHIKSKIIVYFHKSQPEPDLRVQIAVFIFRQIVQLGRRYRVCHFEKMRSKSRSVHRTVRIKAGEPTSNSNYRIQLRYMKMKNHRKAGREKASYIKLLRRRRCRPRVAVERPGKAPLRPIPRETVALLLSARGTDGT